MIGSSRSFAAFQLIQSPRSTSCLDLQFLLEPSKRKDMSRARNRSVEEDPAALPDLSPGMQLSDIRKLPLSSLRHYTGIYNLPGDGTKQSLSQRLYDYLQAKNSSSSGDCDQSEGEHIPSRSSTPHRRHSRRHTVSKESGSSTEGEHTRSQSNHCPHVERSHRRHNCHCSHLRPSLQSKDDSSSTEGERIPSEESHSHHQCKKRRRYHCQKKRRSHHRSSSFSSSTSQSSTDDSSYSSSSTISPEPKRQRRQVSSSSSSSPHP